MVFGDFYKGLPTNPRMDGQTPSYRDARTHLRPCENVSKIGKMADLPLKASLGIYKFTMEANAVLSTDKCPNSLCHLTGCREGGKGNIEIALKLVMDGRHRGSDGD